LEWLREHGLRLGLFEDSVLKRQRNVIIFKATRVACLVLAPYWYFRISISPDKPRPRDYFLAALRNSRNRIFEPFLFIAVLSIAARSFDAVLALDALKAIEARCAGWALSQRELQLLVEAELWLRKERNSADPIDELVESFSLDSRISDIESAYKAFKASLVSGECIEEPHWILPALKWEWIASKLEADGSIRASRDAVYQALRFVPDTDPRRSDLVARFIRLDSVVEVSDVYD
jgi:hypothetical protein